MLNFFKRKPIPPNDPTPAGATRPRSAAAAAKSALPAEPAPLPEVREGNLESDWALWEDSVAFQDSQMPSTLGELDSVKDRTQAKKDEGVDPYAAVRRRG